MPKTPPSTNDSALVPLDPAIVALLDALARAQAREDHECEEVQRTASYRLTEQIGHTGGDS